MPSRSLVPSVSEKRKLSEMSSHSELLIDFGGTVVPPDGLKVQQHI